MTKIFHPLELEICTTVGRDPKDIPQTDIRLRQRYLVELVKDVNALPDDKYDELSDAAITWFETAVDSLTNRARIPDFNDLDVGINEDIYQPDDEELDEGEDIEDTVIEDTIDEEESIDVGDTSDVSDNVPEDNEKDDEEDTEKNDASEDESGRNDGGNVDAEDESEEMEQEKSRLEEEIAKSKLPSTPGPKTIAQKKILSAMSKAQKLRVKNRRKGKNRKMSASRKAREIVIRSFLKGEVVTVDSVGASLTESGYQLSKASIEFVIYEVINTLEVLANFGVIESGGN